jgi:hypothetical protein
MEGLSIFFTLGFLLLIAFIGLIRSQTMLGVFGCFILLTLVSYMTIYMFHAE